MALWTLAVQARDRCLVAPMFGMLVRGRCGFQQKCQETNMFPLGRRCCFQEFPENELLKGRDELKSTSPLSRILKFCGPNLLAKTQTIDKHG